MPSIRKRATRALHNPRTSRPQPSNATATTPQLPLPAWTPPRTKKDKRTLKHGILLDRIQDGGIRKPSAVSRSTASGVKKTRRPGKKLKADVVSGLRDVLAEIEDDAGGEYSDEWEGIDEGEGSALPGGKRRRRRKQTSSTAAGKMVMKSLPHRAGAMKRKRNMERGEMERFGRNLAQMVGAEGQRSNGMADVEEKDGSSGLAAGQGEKWAALRRFIEGTMEKDRAFAVG
ncbi:ribosome biogenesis protein SLX9-domain-containing protein [Neohortaea acidophila]|uniref:Ribosome biogenesis protein SLX9 n=1 Tax=Neohortaea acidophila TaxID=245834 RepID=A0A6A6Q0M8_9PEZI|nr:ribosome biogenesis protein SLX9-domain-containing protein [Neohortaea acidophila]KAF2485815.1 ribosome biogenesis protein SLX9-domain-containing protein [Neohortaea acidophila]